MAEVPLYLYYYVAHKAETVRTMVELTLCIFLPPPTVKFPTCDIFPCNTHETHYDLNSVY